MKAAIVERAGVLTVRDIPAPVVGAYDVLCELLYGATCTGTDTHIIDGVFPWASPYPLVLGHESVGRVVELGSKVRNYRVGDLVTRVGTPPTPDGAISVTWGGFAEFGLAQDHWAMAADGLPPVGRVNQILPLGVDPRHAPMFTTWRETYSYLSRLGMPPHASVLVIGSGGNGLSLAVNALHQGAARVAMVGSARLAAAVSAKTSIAPYFDYTSADLVAQLRDAQPEGFDVIIDALGKSAPTSAVLPCLKIGGILAVYGIDELQSYHITPLAAPRRFTFQGSGPYDEAEAHQAVLSLYLEGKLDASLWYDPQAPYPLTEIGAAFEAMRNRVSPKALITLTPSE